MRERRRAFFWDNRFETKDFTDGHGWDQEGPVMEISVVIPASTGVHVGSAGNPALRVNELCSSHPIPSVFIRVHPCHPWFRNR